MIDSTRLRHEGDQAAGGTAELVVEPDARRQGQDAHAHARAQALGRAGAVALQAEDVLEGLKDRLDPLADAPQVRSAARRLVLASGPDHLAAELGHGKEYWPVLLKAIEDATKK